jgi:hypothetical protein
MVDTVYKPGLYTVISDDKANIRREPRIINNPSNVVGQHNPGTQIEVHEILVDKNFMVWGRISAVHPGTGRANWMCIHTGNRMNLKPVESSTTKGKTLKVYVDDVLLFEKEI